MSDKIQVGEKILAYLKCIQQLEVLSDHIYKAFELNYGDILADNIMSNVTINQITSIHDTINKHMCYAIHDSLARKGEITEI
jgi:hypothetical protein